MAIDERKNGINGRVIQIPIDNLLLFTSFQNGRKREYRKRKAAVARFCGAWVKENDQAVFLVLYTLKRDGSRLPRSFASNGRIAHFSP